MRTRKQSRNLDRLASVEAVGSENNAVDTGKQSFSLSQKLNQSGISSKSAFSSSVPAEFKKRRSATPKISEALSGQSIKEFSSSAPKFVLHNKKQKLPVTLDRSALEQNLFAISFLSTEALSAISSLSEESIEGIFDQPNLQEQLSIIRDFSAKTMAALSSAPKQFDKSFGSESNLAAEKMLNLEIQSAAEDKPRTYRDEEAMKKKNSEFDEVTRDDYEFNLKDEKNYVAMSVEEMIELNKRVAMLPVEAIGKLIQIIKSNDADKVAESGESFDIDIDELKPVTLHEMKAFVHFYLDKELNQIHHKQPKIKEPEKGKKKNVPCTRKNRDLVSKSHVTLPFPKKNPAAFKDPEFLTERKKVLEKKLRALDGDIRPIVQKEPFSKFHETSKSEEVGDSSKLITHKPTPVLKKTRAINKLLTAKLDEPLATILSDDFIAPDQQLIEKLRKEERDRRDQEVLSRPDFTEQIELMEWMENQM